MTKDKQQNCEV